MRNDLKNLTIPLAVVICLAVACAVSAQAPTVGNASITPLPSKVNEPYGVTGQFSRHQRLGNTTGIGNSSFQTESVTSESRTPPGRFRGAAATEVPQPELRYDMRWQPALTPALSQPSFETSPGAPLNSLTPSIRSEPFTSNYSFGAQRQPALEGVHMGQQSLHPSW